MNYYYNDKNNNRYALISNVLSYSPMDKKNSSSGTYDGGNPWSKELSKIELVKLLDVFERAIWTTTDHSENRTMGSSYLRKPDMEVKVYLAYNSASQVSISKLLLSLND